MLSDDLTRGITKVANVGGRFITSAARGAIMFAGIAIAAWVVAMLLPTLLGFAGIVGGMPIQALASGAILAWAGYAAVIGAAILGFTSLLPGKAEGSLKSLMSDKPSPEPAPEQALETGVAPAQEQTTSEIPRTRFQDQVLAQRAVAQGAISLNK